MSRRRAHRLRYGPARSQFGVLSRAPEPGAPIVVLVHGGFWRGPYNRWLMWWLAHDLSKRGLTSFNVEYRRMGILGGGGGWPETFDDVVDAVDELAAWTRSTCVDGAAPKIIVVGHSAGGHLALVAAARRPGVIDGVISVAGPTDLRRLADEGSDAVRELLSGAPDGEPDDERYRTTSPIEMLPIGVPLVCVHGSTDSTVCPGHSSDFVAAAAVAGDDTRLELIPGEGHRDALRPGSQTWAAVMDAVRRFTTDAPPAGAGDSS